MKKYLNKRTVIGVIGSVAGAAAIFSMVWLNLHALEQQRIQEYVNATKKLAEMATTFVMGKEYNNLLALMRYQTQTSAIRFMAYYLEHERVLQAGQENELDLVMDLPRVEAGVNHQIKQTSKILYVDYVLPFQKAMAAKQHILRVAYSLQAFHARKRIIFFIVAAIMALLCTIAILWVMLYQAHENLKQEEADKTLMVKAIAHDALHYVTVIKVTHDNLLSAFNKGKKVKDMEEIVARVLDSNDSLTKLLENLKYNEYLRQGRIINQPEKILWIDLITSIITDLQPLLRQKSVQVNFIQHAKPYWIFADKELMKRVIVNLLHNAFKYTRPDSTITIWLQLEQQMLKTFISDQGAGIPQPDWERIFEPSVRLEDETYLRPEDKRGTGLGLSNSRAFVRLYGGEMGVFASQAGEGTTFYFTLPMAGNEAGANEAIPPVEKPGQANHVLPVKP